MSSKYPDEQLTDSILPVIFFFFPPMAILIRYSKILFSLCHPDRRDVMGKETEVSVQSCPGRLESWGCCWMIMRCPPTNASLAILGCAVVCEQHSDLPPSWNIIISPQNADIMMWKCRIRDADLLRVELHVLQRTVSFSKEILLSFTPRNWLTVRSSTFCHNAELEFLLFILRHKVEVFSIAIGKLQDMCFS